jgi:hypothetical protein
LLLCDQGRFGPAEELPLSASLRSMALAWASLASQRIGAASASPDDAKRVQADRTSADVAVAAAERATGPAIKLVIPKGIRDGA